MKKVRAWVAKQAGKVREAAVRAVSSMQVRRLQAEEGQTMVEYGLILALIAVVVILVVTTLGTKITAEFQTIVTAL